MRNSLLALGAVLVLASAAAAWWLQLVQPRPVMLIPTLSGKPEYCLTCHSDVREISPSHPVKVFGCVSCHGGERLALNASLAHSTMRGGANPSDLSVVEQSCGGSQCHSGSAADQQDHIQRVMGSVQSTYAGAIANILYTYGLENDMTARYGMHAVQDDVIATSSGVQALQQFSAAPLTTRPLMNSQRIAPRAISMLLQWIRHRMRDSPAAPHATLR